MLLPKLPLRLLTITILVAAVGIACGPARPDANQSANDNSTSSNKAIEMPSDEAVEAMVHSSVADLEKAVESGDFSGLYDNASSDFRSTYTLEQVRDNFRPYVEKKDQIIPILKQSAGMSADFDRAVSFRTEKGLKILVANGVFATSPQTLHFETEYVNRGGEWKLLALVLNIK